MDEKSRVFVRKKKDDSLRLEIGTLKPSWLMLCVLFALGLICLIFPFSLLFVTALDIGVGYVITLIIFLGSSIFFFRNFLWSLHGKEVYDISSNKLEYYYDYKLFKDNLNSLLLSDLKIGYCKKNNPNDVIMHSKMGRVDDFDCYLVFVNKEEFIKSSIAVHYKNVNDVVNSLGY